MSMAALMPENGDPMAFEMIVGLWVADQEKYAQYRAEMTPLLEAAGGRFRYDFEVARTLKCDEGHDVNRVFMIQFPDQAAKEVFFADPRYLEIRGRLFTAAVERTIRIAQYTT
jgi:uncharacterized protein (DUF1330 family)